METILSKASVSITELKRNPSAVIEAADNEAVAVLVHNRPSAYLVLARAYQDLRERLDDLELAELGRSRVEERRINVTLDELWHRLRRLRAKGMPQAGSGYRRSVQQNEECVPGSALRAQRPSASDA